MHRKLVLNANDDRPIWSMPPDAVERVRRSLPSDWNLHVVDAPVSSRGDGGSVTADAVDAARGAEVYVGAGVPRDIFLAAGPALRWAHSTTAGISSFLYPEMRASDVALTNSAGIHAPPMAETVLAMALYFARGLDYAVQAQRGARWEQEPFIGADSRVREISGSRMVILGAGGIGSAVAERARPLGVTVRLLNSRVTCEGLNEALESADFLVIAVPDTPKTRGLIGRDELARLGSDAVLINVARGSVVDEQALTEALQAERLRGAALDVFSIEPLPPDSPLWKLPNVLITPHVSAVTRRFWDRQLELILDNVDRYLHDRPLRNLVDKSRGY